MADESSSGSDGTASPGWYPDGSGGLRWWDGHAWTEHRSERPRAAFPAPSFLPAAAPATSGGRSGRGLLVGAAVLVTAVVVTLAAVGLGRTVARTVAEDAAARGAGTPGYVTFNGSGASPLAVGAPWGRACMPVVINPNDAVPDAVYAQVAQVVAEARTAGLNVALETRQHTFVPGDLHPAGLTRDDVVFVPVFTDSVTGLRRPDGGPNRTNVGWDTAPAPDRRHDELLTLQMTMHLGTIGDDPVEQRRAVRKLIGWTQGISDSSVPGSALPLGDAQVPDAFTDGDVAAMKVMSGCDSGAATSS